MHSYQKVPDFNNLKSLPGDLKGIFWDMDGTICNTEHLHAKALANLFQLNHVSISAETNRLIDKSLGLSDEMVLKEIKNVGLLGTLPLREFLQEKNQLFLKVLDNVKPASILDPEIIRLLNEIYLQEIPMTLVTSSEKKVAEAIIEKLQISHFFKFIITRENTSKNKPAPDPYLLALSKNGFIASEVLIIEDSEAGMMAAKAAGIKFIQAKWY